MSSSKSEKTRYTVQCQCGHTMQVRQRHFGRLCQCKRCKNPIYVCADNVSPPLSQSDRQLFRCFDEKEIPVYWEEGDLLMDLYEVLGTLGTGGMGVVYHVRHRGWDQELAVKTPLSKVLADKDWTEQFNQECAMWINLAPHPNTVCCHYVRSLGGIPRLFVEYVDGANLSHHIHKRWLYFGGPERALPHLLHIGIQFAWGLQHAHEAGLIHLDVKPNNVLLARNGNVKVTDFGIAQIIGRSSGLAEDNAEIFPVGTPAFRSPEHELPEGITPKADIWGWALSILSMFSGSIHWKHGRQAPQALEQLLTRGPRLPGIPRIPKNVETLLRQCFLPDPDQRPVNMMEAAAVLCEAYRDATGEAYPHETPKPRGITADLLNNRAVSLLDLDRSEESVALWNQALAADSQHLPTRYNALLHRWRSGVISDTAFFHEAYQLCETFKKDWRPRCYLARALVEMGSAKAALKLLQGLKRLTASERDVAFSLALAQNKRCRDKRVLLQFQAHSSPVTALDLSLSAASALTASEAGRARLWHLEEGRCTAVYDGHRGRINAVALSPDEKTALTAGDDASIRIWDAQSGECRLVLRGHDGPVLRAIFSHDGQRIISGGIDGSLCFWTLDTGAFSQALHAHAGGVTGLIMAPSGLTVISAGQDRRINAWHLKTGQYENNLLELNDPITAIDMCHDANQILLSTGPNMMTYDLQHKTLKRCFNGLHGTIDTLQITLDGRIGLSAGRNGNLRLWDMLRGQCLRTLCGRAPARLSRNGRFAMAAVPGGKVRIWAIHGDVTTPLAPFMLCQDRVGEPEELDSSAAPVSAGSLQPALSVKE